VKGTSWYRNEPFDSIILVGGEFVDHFIKYKITENDSDPCSAEMRIWRRRFVE